MPRLTSRFLVFAFAATPFIFVCAQQSPTTAEKQAPTCEQVFKKIEVFKGVPASDLIPSMEFMAASLKLECSDCHDAKDYSADTQMKTAARHMVLMQRDINEKHFNGRNQVTCMSCHRGSENPVGTPIPDGVTLRHKRVTDAPKPEDLFAKFTAAVGKPSGILTRTGTLTAPNDMTHKVETLPLEFTQGPGGKFELVSGSRKVASDGSQVTYGGQPMTDEPAFLFARIGHDWRGDDVSAGLDRLAVSGKDMVGKTSVLVVRGSKAATSSTQEFYFDSKSNLLIRQMNARRSSLGSVVSVIDYANYRKVGDSQVPMKVTVTFAGGQQWIMDFKSVKSG